MRILNERECEMLTCLWHLRYLATSQLHETWYAERSLGNCQCRLSRLGKAGMLERVRLLHPRWRAVWRLGRAGFAQVAETVGQDLKPYQHLSPLHLPHLVETNDVFLELAPRGRWTWDKLPFQWLGSHRCNLAFVSNRRDPDTGAPRRKNRLLRPDAVLVPGTSSDSARVFVELDRSTEALASATGRTSIRGKLQAYKEFLFGLAPEGGTWYARAFGDTRPVVVVFVVPPTRRASDRRKGISELVAGADRRMARLVRCVSASDPRAIREACGLSAVAESPDAKAPPRSIAGAGGPAGAGEASCTAAAPTGCTLSRGEMESLQRFYQVSIEAYRRLHPESSVRPRFRSAASHARQALARFSGGTDAGDAATPSARGAGGQT